MATSRVPKDPLATAPALTKTLLANDSFRQGSVVKKSLSQLQPSHRVTLSEAKDLSRSAESSFASLRMTGLTLSVGEELSRSFEPCLRVERIVASSHSGDEGISPSTTAVNSVTERFLVVQRCCQYGFLLGMRI